MNYHHFYMHSMKQKLKNHKKISDPYIIYYQNVIWDQNKNAIVTVSMAKL